MIIRELYVSNFLSYYGNHSVKFERGINYLTGHCGSGRSNLAKAIVFAIMGNHEWGLNHSINYYYKDECSKVGEATFCEVKAIVDFGEKSSLCRNTLFLGENGKIKQSLSIPVEVAEIAKLRNLELIYIDSHSLFDDAEKEQEDPEAPLIEGFWRLLLERLVTNLNEGIGMAILDQTFLHFGRDYAKMLQQYLAELPMEQLIIIQTEEPQLDGGYRIVQIGEDRSEGRIGSMVIGEANVDVKGNIGEISRSLPQPTYTHKKNLEAALNLICQQIKRIDEENNLTIDSVKKNLKAIFDCREKKDFSKATVFGCLIADKLAVLKKIIQAKLELTKLISIISKNLEETEDFTSIATAIHILKDVEKTIQCPFPVVFQKIKEAKLLLTLVITVAIKEEKMDIDTEQIEVQSQEIKQTTLKEAQAEIDEMFLNELQIINQYSKKE